MKEQTIDICERCQDEINSMLGWPDITGITYDHGITLHIVSGSECEFWIHLAFNKFIECIGWKLLSSEEKNALFALIKKETPNFYEKMTTVLNDSDIDTKSTIENKECNQK